MSVDQTIVNAAVRENEDDAMRTLGALCREFDLEPRLAVELSQLSEKVATTIGTRLQGLGLSGAKALGAFRYVLMSSLLPLLAAEKEISAFGIDAALRAKI
jgi:hypothetical protein